MKLLEEEEEACEGDEQEVEVRYDAITATRRDMWLESVHSLGDPSARNAVSIRTQ